MHDIVPGITRFTFVLHLAVAVMLGLLMILFPATIAGWWGLNVESSYNTVVQLLGAAILGLGGVTSYVGYRAVAWEEVGGIVRGEIVYLALQTIILLMALVQDRLATAFGIAALIVTVLLLGLFVLSWVRRPDIAS